MKKILLYLTVFLTGCSTVEVNRGKFYIKTDVLPTITNDKKYRSGEEASTKILIEKNKATYLFQYRF